ncbi:unnamed protein product [Ixodes hexagonus]
MLGKAYQYTMACKNSEDNLNADALSRLLIDGRGEKVNDCAASFYLGQLDMCLIDMETLQEAGVKDRLYSKALKFTQTGWPEKVKSRSGSIVQEEVGPYGGRRMHVVGPELLFQKHSTKEY